MIDFAKHTRKGRIANAMSFSNMILMPFLVWDITREVELHNIAKVLGFTSKTLHTYHTKRYGMVMISRDEQRSLL